MKKIGLIILLAFILNSNIYTVYSDDDAARASWVINDVYLDGKVTNGFEWDECRPYYYTIIDSEIGPSKKTYLTIWLKNDETYLYVLYRIKWSNTDYDSADQAYLSYFWETQNGTDTNLSSDAAWLRLSGGSKDKCNYTDNGWVLDRDMGGTNDVIGYGNYDGLYYWYEFRKDLNSSDGLDWEFYPGQVIGGAFNPPSNHDMLVAGFLDISTNMCYEKTISIQLKRNPYDRIIVGGSLTPEVSEGFQSLIFLSISILLVSIILGYTVTSYKYIQKKNSHHLNIFSYHTSESRVKILTKNYTPLIKVISMSIGEKVKKILLIKNLFQNFSLEQFKEYLSKIDEELVPTVLFGLIAFCLMLAVILIITNSRIIDDITYPYSVVTVITLLSPCH